MCSTDKRGPEHCPYYSQGDGLNLKTVSTERTVAEVLMELNKTQVLDTQEQTFVCIILKDIQTINKNIITKLIMGILRPHIWTTLKHWKPPEI